MARKTYSKFRQQWWKYAEIARQLRSGQKCTMRSLATALEVNPRSVRRYIGVMCEELDAPVAFDRVSGSYRLTNTTWTMPANICLGVAELQTLAVAVQAVRPVIPAPLTEQLDKLLAKLLDGLPEVEREEIRRTQGQIEFVPAAILSKGVEWVAPLLHAIREERSVDMSYYVRTKDCQTQRRFDPYYLRNYQGTWYTVGYDHLTQYWPILNLARIGSLTLSEDIYQVRKFSAADYFKDSLGVMVGGTPGPVRLRLTGYAASTADERIWPSGFTYQAIKPDEGILSGHLANLTDLLHWVSSFQCEAEILSAENRSEDTR